MAVTIALLLLYVAPLSAPFAMAYDQQTVLVNASFHKLKITDIVIERDALSRRTTA